MEKQNINKEVDETDLNRTEENILVLEKLFLKEIQEIMTIESGQLTKITHLIMSIIDRAISFNRAFISLTKYNNYNTAICLIRLQIDNCLRLFAYSIAKNSNEFYDKILDGVHIRNMLDRDNKKMTDDNLVSKLDVIFPGMKLLYKNTSGFIHFSKNHIFINNKIEIINDGELKLKTKIGDIDNLNIEEKVDYAFNMFMASKNLLELIRSYRIELQNQTAE
jgi:hypothetical protein